ncbi:eIF-3 p25 subunit 11 [Cryptosporidium sp. chipmunk genotype I]|uniref:eIF-3 p25 subunit 11 n=1 Tax=Cryptosporidium sp. chipmunk genotype I TaxID=1280935 RepID=UPI00351A487B|nr:eIF-3 p25 subunit 11 [Cryptosporidium sp. chipmunk genotype I]
MTQVDQKIIGLLNSASRYDVSNLDIFENCVRDQINKGQYSILNNLVVLLQYSIYPKRTNLEIVQDILLLSIIRGPLSSDFLSCTYQIPLSVQNDPNIKQIIQLNDLLTSCRYVNMWALLKTNDYLRSKAEKVQGFYDSIRDIIVYSINCSHSCISTVVLSELLDLPKDSAELKDIIEKNKWILDSACEIIRIPLSESPIENVDSNTNKNKSLGNNEVIFKNYLNLLSNN